jgi:hypothetical protein
MQPYDLNRFQSHIINWANEALPDRTPKDLLIKMHEEVTDMAKKPTSILESADVMILLLDFVGFYGYTADQLLEAVYEKMEINKTRKWAVDRRTTITRHEGE